VALLRLFDDGIGTLLLSVALALEYEATCWRMEHRLATALDDRDIEDFINGLIDLAEPVEMHFRLRPRLRDPGDEMVLETAVNGQAEALVTFNQRDFRAAADFGIEVLYPREALRRMIT
jgi:predicted nucleic acid-binding protein